MTEGRSELGGLRQAGVVFGKTGHREETAATAVLLCEDLKGLGNGLDLGELRRRLEEADAGVRVTLIGDLCHRPEEVSGPIAAGARHMVLGLCSHDWPGREVASQVRKAGLDPLGVETVNLGAFCAMVRQVSRGTEKASFLLSAAVARARAYPGSNPKNLRLRLPSLPREASRRDLFTLPPVEYQVVACIDDDHCAAGSGCDLCVRACPSDALRRVGERVLVNRAPCDGCGLCVTACPRRAVRLPGNSLAQFEAQITALLELGSVALPEHGILFTCRHGTRSIERAGPDGAGASPRWLPVEVPCAAMIPASWVIQCVARGATVGVARCGDGCPRGGSDAARGMMDYCRELLRSLGGSPGSVQEVGPEEGPDSEQPFATGRGAARSEGRRDGGSPSSVRSGPRGLAGSLLRLAQEHAAPAVLSLRHPCSPFGAVELDAQRCTGCGACAESCPTGALGFARHDEEIALTFDARSCIACGLCVGVCPEAGAGAIRMERVTDLTRLSEGRATLHRDTEARCVSCGGPIAPRGMLHRVEALIGLESAALAERIRQYCASCRVDPQGPRRPSEGVGFR